MSDGNHDEVLSEFTGVTGVDKDRAKFYLESANWDLSVNIYIHRKCASQCKKCLTVIRKHIDLHNNLSSSCDEIPLNVYHIFFQLALSSYYEGDGDANINDDDDDDVESSSPQPPQAPTSLFASGGEQSKPDAKDKNTSKNKYNVGGARIVTLNNMASDDDEEDDGSGQVRLLLSFKHSFQY